MVNELGYLTAVRTSYDTVAADYADLLRPELAQKPLDRALLGTFAERVRADGVTGPVADLGCGPGRITAYLHELGLDAYGVDLSPGMVEVARRTYPHLRFDEGRLSDLDIADGALAGAIAWYSIIHTPTERLPAVFAEFHRVLRPGGHLLLAFQAGDEPLRHLTQAYGHAISLDVYRRSPDLVAELLGTAGLAVYTQVIRQPELPQYESSPQAYMMARRPGGSGPEQFPAVMNRDAPR